jgi:hypothetical protein
MIYLATHFKNYYETAPAEALVKYIEDLSLWGTNTVLVSYPTFQYEGIGDPAARQWLARVKRILGEARKRGLRVGLIQAPNQGYQGTPEALRAAPVAYRRGGNGGINLCAAKPAARALLAEIYGALFDEFRQTGLDYYVTWPYDEGGCGCDQCRPWGVRGYLEVARRSAGLVHSRFPACKVILSTWCFEDEQDENPYGEWRGLEKALADDPAWLEGLMADGHDDYFPAYLLDHPTPGGLPLLNFPEISMFGMYPWGGYGMNPLPAHFQKLWDRLKGRAAGGAPYSEGIYEDLNKALWSQFYWDPQRSAAETVEEYASFEFSPAVAAQVVKIIRLFEQNHDRRTLQESSRMAFELAQEAESRLPEQARTGWRWRLLFLRALIDKELFEREGRLEGEALEAAFAELARIYQVTEATWDRLRPPVAQSHN